ncbi:hypothetical protein [Paenibacillus aceti]|uniref:SWIM-type domain-containing protein n=1 Tax=Paenibacillus aceti TaxID=1820010 RepID=A0ABQ1VW63_9BACL|nr:hypothetical protein [Paenibacillus aceti]GGF99282.1 hypothetical protein GCM10010913_21340 [Paenibacillus aceti]
MEHSSRNPALSQVELKLTAEGLRVTLPAQEVPEEAGQNRRVVLLPRLFFDQARQNLLDRLQQFPLQLAALDEEGAEAVADLLPRHFRQLHLNEEARKDPHAAMVRGSVCSCGQMGCAHISEALEGVEAAWSAVTAATRLEWLGWTAETLVHAVLDSWAAQMPMRDAEAELKRIAGRLDTPAYRSKQGELNLAEWLAEMVHNGRLHQPGPELHDVEINLSQAKLQVQADRLQAWTNLLPGVPGAAQGLSLILEQTGKNAEQLAKRFRAQKP